MCVCVHRFGWCGYLLSKLNRNKSAKMCKNKYKF